MALLNEELLLDEELLLEPLVVCAALLDEELLLLEPVIVGAALLDEELLLLELLVARAVLLLLLLEVTTDGVDVDDIEEETELRTTSAGKFVDGRDGFVHR